MINPTEPRWKTDGDPGESIEDEIGRYIDEQDARDTRADRDRDMKDGY